MRVAVRTYHPTTCRPQAKSEALAGWPQVPAKALTEAPRKRLFIELLRIAAEDTTGARQIFDIDDPPNRRYRKTESPLVVHVETYQPADALCAVEATLTSWERY